MLGQIRLRLLVGVAAGWAEFPERERLGLIGSYFYGLDVHCIAQQVVSGKYLSELKARTKIGENQRP